MPKSKVLAIDATRCRGCFSCAIACATRNFDIGDLSKSRIKVTPFWKEAFFVPTSCFQCEVPYCAQVCPINALTKNTDSGIVELDKEKCIGCKLCLMACPFGNISFANGIASKCNLCEGDPICVKACEYDALTFVDADEIGARKKVLVSEKILELQKELLTGEDIPDIQNKLLGALGRKKL